MECVRPKTPLSMEDAIRETEKYVNKYNNERLHGAIGYIAPVDKLEGRAQIIFDERKRKLAEAQERRKAEHSTKLCDESNKPIGTEPLDILPGMKESSVTG